MPPDSIRLCHFRCPAGSGELEKYECVLPFEGRHPLLHPLLSHSLFSLLAFENHLFTNQIIVRHQVRVILWSPSRSFALPLPPLFTNILLTHHTTPTAPLRRVTARRTSCPPHLPVGFADSLKYRRLYVLLLSLFELLLLLLLSELLLLLVFFFLVPRRGYF